MRGPRGMRSRNISKLKVETYPSDACLDLGLGYDQICRMIEDLNSEVTLGDI
jgi:hypothetical protein